jgi:hypothetical protein
MNLPLIQKKTNCSSDMVSIRIGLSLFVMILEINLSLLHLLIHLVDDIELVGVVSTRWMFLFERYMKTLNVITPGNSPRLYLRDAW